MGGHHVAFKIYLVAFKIVNFFHNLVKKMSQNFFGLLWTENFDTKLKFCLATKCGVD